MRLAKPIISNNGRVLCGEGTELSDSLISRLENLGVEGVTVEGFPVSMPGAEEKSTEDLIAELEERFKRVHSDNILMKIKEIFKKQLIEQEEEKKAYLEKQES